MALTQQVVRRVLTAESNARLALREARANALLDILDAKRSGEAQRSPTSIEIAALVNIETMDLARIHEAARIEKTIVLWLMRDDADSETE